jgi:hypothetical protein
MAIVNDRAIIVYRQWSDRADCWFRWRYSASGASISVSEIEESEWIQRGRATSVTVRARATAPTPRSFWSYQVSDATPDFDDVPSDVFAGTRDGWESMSPGMRREIMRSAKKKG